MKTCCRILSILACFSQIGFFILFGIACNIAAGEPPLDGLDFILTSVVALGIPLAVWIPVSLASLFGAWKAREKPALHGAFLTIPIAITLAIILDGQVMSP